jgi:nitrate/nitrite transport system ATP-binding protein
MIARLDPKSHTDYRAVPTGKPFLKIDHVDKSFTRAGKTTEVLKDVSLAIEKGEFVAIIGHSGCGKSTLLNLIAGLTTVTKGAVLLENKEVNEPGPERAVVFQNHSLLPWLTVYDNVRLAVDKVFGSTRSKTDRHDWVMHNLDLVQMGHARDKRPAEISGGMKQRVGIARALAMEPKVMLMDEPFGALDALTRAHLQDSVMQIHARLGNTAIMITHDIDEAVLLADRIVMMTNGPAAKIGEVLAVDLPRPRNRLEMVTNPTYIAAREAVMKFLYERHRYVESAA